MRRVGQVLLVALFAAAVPGCGGPVDRLRYAVTSQDEDQQLFVSSCGTDPSRLVVARQPESFFTDPQQQGSALDSDRIVYERSGSDLRSHKQVVSLGPPLSPPDGAFVVYIQFKHRALFFNWTSSELTALPDQPWPTAPDALTGKAFDDHMTLDRAQADCDT